MSGIAFIFDTDKRDVTHEFNVWSMKARIAQFTTLMMTLILFALTIVSIITFTTDSWVVISACYHVVPLMRVIYNISTITGILVRTEWFKRPMMLVYIILKAHSVWNFSQTLDNIMYQSCLNESHRLMVVYNKQPEETDREMVKWNKYEIHQYWENLGLIKKKLVESSKKIRIRADEPIKKSEVNKPVMDTRDIYPNDVVIHEYTQRWETSDMTDSMHVKSLIKRVIGIRYKHDKTKQAKFVKMIEYNAETLPCVGTTRKDAINKAIGSKGTAGQLAKHSGMEDLWKDKTNELTYELWHKITNDILTNTLLTNYIPQKIVQYMLYRKQEPMQRDEDGHLKVTRIMNAPNLLTRVTDCIPFMSFNDAMVEARSNIIGKVGMNIFKELKMLIVYNPGYEAIGMDYKDFDGSQHEIQMIACCAARLRYMLRNKQKAIEMAYMVPRYKRHMFRNVKSTFGIEYDVIGEQASGDITTTDDNTLKSSAIVPLYVEAIITRMGKEVSKRNVKQHYKTAATTGDDTLLIVENVTLDNQDLEKCLAEVATSVGWTIKEDSLQRSSMLQDGKIFFMSHSVDRRWYTTDNRKVRLCFAVLVREAERAAGKWAISSEMSNELSNTNLAKLCSKYLTMTMTSLGNPEIMIASIFMLLSLRVMASDHVGPYSWQGLQAKTLGALTLDNMLKLQTGLVTIGLRFTCIEVTPWEEDIIRRQTKLMNAVLSRYIDRGIIRQGRVPMFEENIVGGCWNYNGVLQTLSKVMYELEKSSHIRGQEIHGRWWQANLDDQNADVVNLKRVIQCPHSDVKNFYYEGNIVVKIKCLQCWVDDREDIYTGINVCIDK